MTDWTVKLWFGAEKDFNVGRNLVPGFVSSPCAAELFTLNRKWKRCALETILECRNSLSIAVHLHCKAWWCEQNTDHRTRCNNGLSSCLSQSPVIFLCNMVKMLIIDRPSLPQCVIKHALGSVKFHFIKWRQTIEHEVSVLSMHTNDSVMFICPNVTDIYI